MSQAADSLQRRYGANLSESLGVRTAPPPADRFPGETGPPATSPDDGRTRAREAGHMELERIVPDPDQPRKEFSPEAIDRLAASLLKHGQLQPLRVRWNGDLGKWVVISGERRYRAALKAGLKTVACIFADGELSASDILQEQMVENCLREDLKPSEQAEAYRQLMALHGWTAKQLAEELHVSEGAISKALSLTRLPEDLRTQADDGAVPATALYEVAKVEDEDDQREIVRRIKAEGLKRDDVVEVVREAVGRSKAKGRGAKAKPRQVTSRTFRAGGYKVTVENRRGIEDGTLAAALAEIVDQVQGRQGRGEAA
jgi:ParB family transcriptional regulator, chromosome partitioning protein